MKTKTENQIVMSIDLGRTNGITVADTQGNIFFSEEYVYKYYDDFYYKIKELILLYKPSVVLIPYPTFRYKVIISQAKLMGIVELLCEKNGITCIEVNDSQCKKAVMGKGSAKKQDIMIYYNHKSEHVADSLMFIDWYLKTLK